MLHRFVRDFLVYALGTGVSSLIGLAFLPLYVRVLTQADLGAVELLVTFGTLVNVVVGLELPNAVARFFPDQRDEAIRICYASSGLWFGIAMFSVFGAAASLAGPWAAPWLLRVIAPQPLYYAGVAAACMSGLAYQAVVQLRFQLRARASSVLLFVQALVTQAASLTFVLCFRWGPVGVLLAQTLGSAVLWLLALWCGSRYYRLQFDAARLREMLAYSVPLIPSSLGVMAALYIDRSVIQYQRSIEEVGVYSIASRFAYVMTLLTAIFQMTLTPLVHTQFREPTTPQAIALVGRSYAALVSWIVVGLALFSPEVLAVLTTESYRSAAAVIPVLSTAIALASGYIFGPGLWLAKKTGQISAINIAWGLVNLGLNLAWAPHYGVLGSAWASLVASMLSAAVSLAAGQAHYPIPHAWFRLTGAIALALAASVGMQYWPQAWLTPLAGLGLKAVLFLIAGGLLAGGVVGFNELRSAAAAIFRSSSEPPAAAE